MLLHVRHLSVYLFLQPIYQKDVINYGESSGTLLEEAIEE